MSEVHKLLCLIRCSGVWDIGRHSVMVHDHGIFYARNRVIQWEWRIG